MLKLLKCFPIPISIAHMEIPVLFDDLSHILKE